MIRRNLKPFPDPVEKLAFGPTSGDNIWPDIPSTLKENVTSYYNQSRELSEKLMRTFALAVKAPHEDFFYEQCKDGAHSMKANFYPKISHPNGNQDTRFAAHTDSTPFTLLAMDDCPNSLQIQNSDGEWVYAEPVPGAFFVNLGDMMAIWTNDKWKATMHRVVWPPREHVRLSIAYFVLMNPGAVVECLPSCLEHGEKPKYEPLTYLDYVNARMSRLEGKY